MLDKINFEIIDSFDMEVLGVNHMNETPTIDYIHDVKEEYIDYYEKLDQVTLLSHRLEFEEIGIESIYLVSSIPEASARTKFYFTLQTILSSADSDDEKEYEKVSNMFRNHKTANAILRGGDYIINGMTMLMINMIGNSGLKYDTLSKQIGYETAHYYWKIYNNLISNLSIKKELNQIQNILIDEMEGYI